MHTCTVIPLVTQVVQELLEEFLGSGDQCRKMRIQSHLRWRMRLSGIAVPVGDNLSLEGGTIGGVRRVDLPREHAAADKPLSRRQNPPATSRTVTPFPQPQAPVEIR